MTTGILPPSEALNRYFLLPENAETKSGTKVYIDNDNIVSHGFFIGNIGLIVPTNIITELVQNTSICRLPQVPIWFLGMVNLRGSMFPVFDIKTLLGMEELSQNARTLLAMQVNEDFVGVMIDEYPVRLRFNSEQQLSGDPPIPKQLRPFSKRCFKEQGRIWIDWDVEGFFSSISAQL
ncbi:MAG: chemotaxis protein CheW [Pseudomonadota bacterium]